MPLGPPPRYTKIPYVPGSTLSLQVTESKVSWLAIGTLDVTVVKPFVPTTISPAMLVQLPSGSAAVLKMFDRRFGPSFRSRYGPGGRHQPIPHTEQEEDQWVQWVNSGQSAPVLQYIHHQRTTEVYPYTAGNFYEDAVLAKRNLVFEAALHDQALRWFQNECRAYDKLAPLQGVRIPEMYAHVCLAIPSSVPKDQSRLEFQACGILIEYIDGISGTTLLNDLQRVNTSTLIHIAQDAIEGAYSINTHGVIMGDCALRNVIIRKSDNRVFYIDFAQVFWRENDVDDATFWEIVRSHDNYGEVAMVLAGALKKKFGTDIAPQLTYPNPLENISNNNTLHSPDFPFTQNPDRKSVV